MLKLDTSNFELLAYLEQCRIKHPIKFQILEDFVTLTAHSRALLGNLFKKYPTFMSKALALVSGDKALLRGTLVYKKSNECVVCHKTFYPHKYRLLAGTCSHACVLKVPARLKKMLALRAQSSIKNNGTAKYHSLQSVKDKRAATMIERHGDAVPLRNPKIKAKYNQTMLNNWGETHSGKTEIVKAKVRCTNISKRGVSNVMQSPEVRSSWLGAMYSTKHYEDASGKQHTVQGYEPQVLSWLSARGFKLVTSPEHLPRIQYTNDNYYFPDARALSSTGNKYLIEVKSPYTLKMDWHKNLSKFNAAKKWCKENDYIFVVAISTGAFEERPIIVKHPTEKTLRESLP